VSGQLRILAMIVLRTDLWAARVGLDTVAKCTSYCRESNTHIPASRQPLIDLTLLISEPYFHINFQEGTLNGSCVVPTAKPFVHSNCEPVIYPFW
jgi:hypothetical protein